MNPPQRGPGVVQITTVPQTLYRLFPRLIERLCASGYSVWAISSEGSWLPREKAAERLGIPVESAPMSRRISPVADLRAVARLRALLRARRPAIAHCHTPKAGLLGGLAARLAGVPVIFYTVRGLPHLTARGLLRALLIGTERLACRFAHRVIAVSPSVRDELLRLRACAPEKLSVPGPGSAQGVDAEGRFNPQRAAGLPSVRAELGLPAGALVLGFVGRLVRDKGFTELWQAWTVLRERHPDLHLLIAGADREPRAGVRQEELDACRADPRVRLVGVVEDIERHYAAMDVFAFPSHREGFSNAVLEAAAMALPVVGFDVIGVRDGVRDGETGRLAPLSDGGRFTALLEELILDPAARARLGANARAWMLRDFRPEDRLRQVEASYREALTQAGIPLPQAEPVA